jgi:hypothetical protein
VKALMGLHNHGDTDISCVAIIEQAHSPRSPPTEELKGVREDQGVNQADIQV